MIGGYLKNGVADLNRVKTALVSFYESHIGPRIAGLVHDEAKVKKAASFAYRFVPFYLRFLVSKERFIEFIANHASKFSKSDVSENSPAV